jgi:hypothetical protein
MALGGLQETIPREVPELALWFRHEKMFCQTWIVIWIVLWARSNFYKGRGWLITPILREPAGDLQSSDLQRFCHSTAVCMTVSAILGRARWIYPVVLSCSSPSATEITCCIFPGGIESCGCSGSPSREEERLVVVTTLRV